MRRVVKISVALLMLGGISVASDKMYQKFGIQSGKITYKITGSMSMMGMTSKTAGKKRVIFSQYGIKELREESKITKENGKIDKSHTITYMDRATIYSVNFNQKRITKVQNQGMMMLGLSDNNTAQKAGMKMLKQMGGKKIGRDKVLGYECDIWEAMGTKQCIYKGITLKTESNIMGVKSSEIATKVDFDSSIEDSDFKLPDFPIYNQSGNRVDRGQPDIDNSAKDFASMMGAMATATSSIGLKSGEKPTPKQQKQIEDAIAVSMLPKMKEEFISQEKVLLFGKECLGSANTLKEANICNQKANKISGEEEENFDEWSANTKKEVLGFIDKALESIECMKKADSMSDIKRCGVNK